MKKLPFYDIRTVRYIGMAGLAVGAVFAFLAAATQVFWIGYIGLALMIAAAVFIRAYYRCPHCGKYLDRNCGEYCQYCGERLN